MSKPLPREELWNLALPDWEDRIRKGRSLLPDNLPLFTAEADFAVAFFDRLRLPDVQGYPLLKDAAGEWFRDIVRGVFGSRDPKTNQRYIRHFFTLVPKGDSKTTYSAALMLVALLMNTRPKAEFLIVAPTQAISETSFEKAAGMIELDPELRKRFHIRWDRKSIRDRTNGAHLMVKTFDLNIITGTILAGVLVDELHLLGKNAHTAKVLTQIRGGLEKTPEGFMVTITTMPDDPPQGAFKTELKLARDIRDGIKKGRTLAFLYEFPRDIAEDPHKWGNPGNWTMVNPNMGRSIQLDSLIEDWEEEKDKGLQAIAVWASQHLNIEVGIGMRTDRWPGAEAWMKRADTDITIEYLIKVCDLIIAGVDGGGLDDLFGFCLLGRHKDTKEWLVWGHSWCHEGVLDRRKSIAAILRDFEKASELTIVDDELADLSEIVDIIERVLNSGLLGGVAVDPAGIGEFVDALAEIDITEANGLLRGVAQGYQMMSPMKSVERKLVNGTLRHCGSSLMAWAVGNLKVEFLATAIRPTKANAGDAKIDPIMAIFNAAAFMLRQPQAAGAFTSEYEMPVWG